MRVQSLLSVALLPVAWAKYTRTYGHGTSTSARCATQVASTSHHGHIPTQTITIEEIVEEIIIVITSRPVHTITPHPVTKTKTVTQTHTATVTDSTITDTFSTTSTITVTKTDTVTSTSTSVETDTATSTSLVTNLTPAASGFIDIYDSSGDFTIENPSRKEKNKRLLSHPHVNIAARNDHQQSPKNAKLPILQKAIPTYPAAVTCIDFIHKTFTEEIVLIESTRTTTECAQTHTVTCTATSTSTKTVVPRDVSVTLSFAVTNTVDTTTTATASTTSTETDTVTVTSTTTELAACQTNNILGPGVQDANGDQGYVPQDYTRDGFLITNVVNGVSDPVGCCAACQTTPQCAYGYLTSVDDGQCLLFTYSAASGTCKVGQEVGSFILEGGATSIDLMYDAFVHFNGPCGYVIQHEYLASN